jgi:hypothetical protein
MREVNLTVILTFIACSDMRLGVICVCVKPSGESYLSALVGRWVVCGSYIAHHDIGAVELVLRKPGLRVL